MIFSDLRLQIHDYSVGVCRPSRSLHVNWDSFKGDFLLVDMLFWEHFLYNAM